MQISFMLYVNGKESFMKVQIHSPKSGIEVRSLMSAETSCTVWFGLSNKPNIHEQTTTERRVPRI